MSTQGRQRDAARTRLVAEGEGGSCGYPPGMAWGLGPDRHQNGPDSRFFGVGSGYSTMLRPTEGVEPIRGGTSPDGAP